MKKEKVNSCGSLITNLELQSCSSVNKVIKDTLFMDLLGNVYDKNHKYIGKGTLKDGTLHIVRDIK